MKKMVQYILTENWSNSQLVVSLWFLKSYKRLQDTSITQNIFLGKSLVFTFR